MVSPSKAKLCLHQPSPWDHEQAIERFRRSRSGRHGDVPACLYRPDGLVRILTACPPCPSTRASWPAITDALTPASTPAIWSQCPETSWGGGAAWGHLLSLSLFARRSYRGPICLQGTAHESRGGRHLPREAAGP